MIKHPIAWLPLTMSLAALALVAGYLALFGVSNQPPADEGAAARIFQLLLAGQAPIVAYFVLKWLPHRPKQAMAVLALQVLAALAALAPVYLLEM